MGDDLDVSWDLVVDPAIHNDLRAMIRKKDKSYEARKYLIYNVLMAAKLHKLTVLGKAGSTCAACSTERISATYAARLGNNVLEGSSRRVRFQHCASLQFALRTGFR